MRTWILQKWHGYARGLLLFGLVFNAVFFWRPTVDVFNLVKITSLWITGIVSLAIWVIWAAERGAWLPKMRLFWAAGAFLAAMLLATLFSQDPGLSLIGLYHRYGGFLPFALYAAIALTLVGLYWERPERLKEIPWAITLAGVIMIPLTLWQAQHNKSHSHGRLDGDGRADVPLRRAERQGHRGEDRHGGAVRRRPAGAVVHADPRRLH